MLVHFHRLILYKARAICLLSHYTLHQDTWREKLSNINEVSVGQHAA